MQFYFHFLDPGKALLNCFAKWWIVDFEWWM